VKLAECTDLLVHVGTLVEESTEVGLICVNTVLSPCDKFNQYNKIVQVSGEKIKPLLHNPAAKTSRSRKTQKQHLNQVS
jgi:hypothetical protein